MPNTCVLLLATSAVTSPIPSPLLGSPPLPILRTMGCGCGSNKSLTANKSTRINSNVRRGCLPRLYLRHCDKDRVTAKCTPYPRVLWPSTWPTSVPLTPPLTRRWPPCRERYEVKSMGQMQHVLQPKLLDIIATPLTLFKNHLQSLVFFLPSFVGWDNLPTNT